MTAIAIQRREEILYGLSQGQYVKDLAESLQVAPEAISQVLAKDPEYKLAREIGAERRLEKYQDGLDQSADALSLARAREGFKAQAWRCEREFPARWGAKNTQTLDLQGANGQQIASITVTFVQPEAAQGRTLEGELSTDA